MRAIRWLVWLGGRVALLVLLLALGGGLIAAGMLPAIGAARRVLSEAERRLARWESGIDLTFPRFPERSTIFAADGTHLDSLYLEENRKVVRLRQVSPVARRAVLAIEDSNFYRHDGLDYGAIGRAFIANLRQGRIEQGASTITQQLARSVIPEVGTEETIARKAREAYVALRLEDRYSKDHLLELYLNDVYFGSGAYGIGTAARRYFHKPARRLNLREGALLASVIAAPSEYSPLDHPRRARARRNLVLDRMAELGWITEDRARKASRKPMGLARGKPRFLRRPEHPYFVEYIKREFLELRRLGPNRKARERLLYQGGLKIHTTLRPDLQRAAKRIADRHLPLPGDPAAAVVALHPRTGAIRTLMGGRDFQRRKFDLASQGRRQAGSAFKPFTLTTALLEGMRPSRSYSGRSPRRLDIPGGQTWEVENAGGASYGTLNLREATTNSVNVVYAQLILDVGPRKVVRTAHRMGIRSSLPAVPSLTLGTASVTPLEMASAYGTLANLGTRCRPFAITKVVDRDGETLLERRRGGCRRAIPRPVALRVVDMLRRVVEAGTGTAANLPERPEFGKTGTTDDFSDAWFVGCTRRLCTSSWVGHVESRKPMRNVHGITVYGGTFPARIWHEFMSAATGARKAIDFPDPPPFRDRGGSERSTSRPDSD